MQAKIKVAVLYGGQSTEHEISLRSARSIIEHLDKDKYEPVPVGIDQNGQWYFNDASILDDHAQEALPIKNESSIVAIPHADPTQERHFDVVFPALHGKLGEDGAIQGLLELANIPYVGCGVLSSAICMDKDMTKRLVESLEIPMANYLTIYPAAMQKLDELIQLIEAEFEYPVFIKPANAGSSIGISKVIAQEQLLPALEAAFAIDGKKVLLEQGLAVRDLEISVLQSSTDYEPKVTDIAGEVVQPDDQFYTKEAKFEAEHFPEVQVPAIVTDEQLATMQAYARDIFLALECEGLARVDFFIETETGQVLFNEINTLPGFTTSSLFPIMWQKSGLSFSDLLDHLIQLALNK